MSSVAAIGAQNRAALSSTKKRSSSSSRGVVKTHALFGRKKVEPPPPPPPPPPSGPFGFLKKKAPQQQQQQQQVRDVEYVPQETMTDAYARVKKQREKKAAMYEAKEKGGLSLFMFNALSAVNFEVRGGERTSGSDWRWMNATPHPPDSDAHHSTRYTIVCVRVCVCLTYHMRVCDDEESAHVS